MTSDKAPKVNVKVCEHTFKATLDAGATINAIDHNTYVKMKGPELRTTNIKAFAYTAKKPVKFMGKFEALIETQKILILIIFICIHTINFLHFLTGNLIIIQDTCFQQ